MPRYIIEYRKGNMLDYEIVKGDLRFVDVKDYASARAFKMGWRVEHIRCNVSWWDANIRTRLLNKTA